MPALHCSAKCWRCFCIQCGTEKRLQLGGVISHWLTSTSSPCSKSGKWKSISSSSRLAGTWHVSEGCGQPAGSGCQSRHQYWRKKRQLFAMIYNNDFSFIMVLLKMHTLEYKGEAAFWLVRKIVTF